MTSDQLLGEQSKHMHTSGFVDRAQAFDQPVYIP